jgi:hypothetical protein
MFAIEWVRYKTAQQEPSISGYKGRERVQAQSRARLSNEVGEHFSQRMYAHRFRDRYALL